MFSIIIPSTNLTQMLCYVVKIAKNLQFICACLKCQSLSVLFSAKLHFSLVTQGPRCWRRWTCCFIIYDKIVMLIYCQCPNLNQSTNTFKSYYLANSIVTNCSCLCVLYFVLILPGHPFKICYSSAELSCFIIFLETCIIIEGLVNN